MSGDKNVVATISTRGAKTSGGKHAVGKILKFRYDMLFFTMVQTRRMVVALTENDMYEQCLKKAKGGRVPSEIEVVYALTLPPQNVPLSKLF